MTKAQTALISTKTAESKILLIRGQKVIIDSDLAALYDVTTSRLNEQVKRNIERFPEDFMFQLTKEEFDNLKSQFATSSSGWGGRRKLPYNKESRPCGMTTPSPLWGTPPSQGESFLFYQLGVLRKKGVRYFFGMQNESPCIPVFLCSWPRHFDPNAQVCFQKIPTK